MEVTTSLLLNRDEALELAHSCGLKWSAWRFYFLVREGYLPPGKVVLREGRKLWISRQGLLEWIAAGGNAADSAA